MGMAWQRARVESNGHWHSTGSWPPAVPAVSCCLYRLTAALIENTNKCLVAPSAAAPRPRNHKLCGAQRGARKRHSAVMLLLVFDQDSYAVQWTRNLRGSLIIRSLEVRRPCLWRR